MLGKILPDLSVYIDLYVHQAKLTIEEIVVT